MYSEYTHHNASYNVSYTSIRSGFIMSNAVINFGLAGVEWPFSNDGNGLGHVAWAQTKGHVANVGSRDINVFHLKFVWFIVFEM